MGAFVAVVVVIVIGGVFYLQVARQLGIPVVLPSWVEDCWERGLDDVVYAADEDVVSLEGTVCALHACGEFGGVLCVCTSCLLLCLSDAYGN